MLTAIKMIVKKTWKRAIIGAFLFYTFYIFASFIGLPTIPLTLSIAPPTTPP